MRNYRVLSCVALLVATLVFAAGAVLAAPELPRMSTEELNARLGEPGLVILDVRAGADWGRATEKIAGSVRVNSGSVGQWAGNYARDQVLVLYCT